VSLCPAAAGATAAAERRKEFKNLISPRKACHNTTSHLSPMVAKFTLEPALNCTGKRQAGHGGKP
jgi:hypothetical protein